MSLYTTVPRAGGRKNKNFKFKDPKISLVWFSVVSRLIASFAVKREFKYFKHMGNAVGKN